MKQLLFIILFLFTLQSVAADSQYAEPADSNNLPGVYQLIDFPVENQPKFFEVNPWPSKCQFFGIYKNGYFLHQETQLGSCDNRIPPSIPESAQEVEWKFVQSGILALSRKDGQLSTQYWKVDKVTSDAHIDNINLDSGDLIMQLIGPENQAVWFRLLRKVSD